MRGFLCVLQAEVISGSELFLRALFVLPDYVRSHEVYCINGSDTRRKWKIYRRVCDIEKFHHVIQEAECCYVGIRGYFGYESKSSLNAAEGWMARMIRGS